MNQILYTGGKKGGMTDIQKIIIFFVVFIIIFGICAIGIGTNLIQKVKNTNTANNTPEATVKYDIKVEFEPQVGGVKLIATCDVKISTIAYWWDEETATTLEVNNNKYETVIPSKQGTHTLKVEITNENGDKKNVSQLVIGDAGPELKILTDGVSNYVIRASDDENVEKVVITLNGETEEIEVNNKEFEYKVPIPQGDSLIDVTVYNLNGLTTNKKAKVTNFGG